MRLKQIAATTMIALMTATSAFAGEGCEKDQGLKVGPQGLNMMMSNPYRLFRAEGEHQCWHRDFIGYKCTVSGVNYTDCQQAFFALQRDNCCNRMYWQGKQLTGATSNSFRITKCTNFF